MVGWYHQLNGYECEQAPGAGDGQGSLVCAARQGVAKSRTQLSNWTELSATVQQFACSLALPFCGTEMKTDLFQSWSQC